MEILPVDIDLPSGNKVVVREKLRPGDQAAVDDAPDVILRPDKSIVIRNATANTLPALLARVIESWTFPGNPQHVLAAGMDAVDEVMDIDDWNCLRDKTKPLLDKLRPEPAPNSRPLSSGNSQQNEITSGS